MIDVSKVNWQAFKKDLQIAKRNEHLWALGSFDGTEQIHLDNENMLEEEIISIECGDYESVVSHYDESVFNDYIKK